jgi:phage baseplate assembly protein W
MPGIESNHRCASSRAILFTDRGERINLPGFGGGLRRLFFESNAAATHSAVRQPTGRALVRQALRWRFVQPIP